MALTEARREALERLCETIVPGSAAVGPTVYIEALLEHMPPDVRAGALAIEAYYSDFVAPGRAARGAWSEIDFNSPLATRLAKDFTWLGIA